MFIFMFVNAVFTFKVKGHAAFLDVCNQKISVPSTLLSMHPGNQPLEFPIRLMAEASL